VKYQNQDHYHSVQAAGIKKFKAMFPDVKNSSGIYVFHRKQKVGQTEVTYGYVGQAKHIIDRLVGHFITSTGGHIDRSIKARGLAWKGGEWNFFVEFYCDARTLDMREQNTIEKYMGMGWQLPYNKTLGGQANKEGVQNTERKGYLVGKSDGMEKVYKELARLVDLGWLHLIAPQDKAYYRGKPRKDIAELAERVKKYLTKNAECGIMQSKVGKQDAKTPTNLADTGEGV